MSPETIPQAVVASHSMLGMRLDYVGPSQYLEAIVAAGRRRESFYCCVANVHMCVLAHDDRAFRGVVNGARYVISDSTILQKARALRHGVRAAGALRGAELMIELTRKATAQGVKVGLIGGRDETVLAALIARLTIMVPGIDIAYAFSPPFRAMTAEEDVAMVAALQAASPGLVLVGLGCPKQERWMAAHVGRIEAALVGVGAAFDFNSGAVRASPAWVHRVGLEWMYRLMREPRRLWRRYLTTSPRFIWLLLCDALGRRT